VALLENHWTKYANEVLKIEKKMNMERIDKPIRNGALLILVLIVFN